MCGPDKEETSGAGGGSSCQPGRCGFLIRCLAYDLWQARTASSQHQALLEPGTSYGSCCGLSRWRRTPSSGFISLRLEIVVHGRECPWMAGADVADLNAATGARVFTSATVPHVRHMEVCISGPLQESIISHQCPVRRCLPGRIPWRCLVRAAKGEVGSRLLAPEHFLRNPGGAVGISSLEAGLHGPGCSEAAVPSIDLAQQSSASAPCRDLPSSRRLPVVCPLDTPPVESTASVSMEHSFISFTRIPWLVAMASLLPASARSAVQHGLSWAGGRGAPVHVQVPHSRKCSTAGAD